MLQLDEEAALETTQSTWYDATTPVGVVELVQLTQRGAASQKEKKELEEREMRKKGMAPWKLGAGSAETAGNDKVWVVE